MSRQLAWGISAVNKAKMYSHLKEIDNIPARAPHGYGAKLFEEAQIFYSAHLLNAKNGVELQLGTGSGPEAKELLYKLVDAFSDATAQLFVEDIPQGGEKQIHAGHRDGRDVTVTRKDKKVYLEVGDRIDFRGCMLQGYTMVLDDEQLAQAVAKAFAENNLDFEYKKT